VAKRSDLPSPTLVERYKELAQRCRALAVSERNPVERARLTKVAAAWDRFAQKAEAIQGELPGKNPERNT
jgi:hypothetical protein